MREGACSEKAEGGEVERVVGFTVSRIKSQGYCTLLRAGLTVELIFLNGF